MGTSNWQNISYNIELVRKLNPYSILDIGIGFGRWGMLFREFLEIWDDGRYDGNWKRKIDGVEIYSGYIKDYHKYFYDNIYVCDALEFLENTKERYDLINMGDVVEHMEKLRGEKIIELAMNKGKYVLINIPIGRYWKQDGTDENPYEAHRSIWYNNDFTKYRHHKIKCFRDHQHRDFTVALLSSDKIKYTNRYGKYFGLKNFLKHQLHLKPLVEIYERWKTKY